LYEIIPSEFIYYTGWVIGLIVAIVILRKATKKERISLLITFAIIGLLYGIGLFIYFCLSMVEMTIDGMMDTIDFFNKFA
jgi:hypothetical protein